MNEDNQNEKKQLEELDASLKEQQECDLARVQCLSEEMAQKISGNLMKEVGEPVFMSIIDGILELRVFKGLTRRVGLTSKRVLDDCRSFTYERDSASMVWMDGYTELKNEQDLEHFYERMVTQEYDRSKYEDKASMNRYKDKHVHGEKKVVDEYSGKDNLYPEKDNAPANYKDPKWRLVAETDHITPLKQIHLKYKDNYALGDDDIKRIANEDFNYAMTAASTNDGRGKGGMTNEQYLNYCKNKGIPIPAEQAERMMSMQEQSEKEIVTMFAGENTKQPIGDSP
jgi:hypothetical protein